MPKPNLSRLVRPLERRPPPPNPLLPKEPPLSNERRAGVAAGAVLAMREHAEREALHDARVKAAEAQRAADDALWSRIVQRQRQAVG